MNRHYQSINRGGSGIKTLYLKPTSKVWWSGLERNGNLYLFAYKYELEGADLTQYYVPGYDEMVAGNATSVHLAPQVIGCFNWDIFNPSNVETAYKYATYVADESGSPVASWRYEICCKIWSGRALPQLALYNTLISESSFTDSTQTYAKYVTNSDGNLVLSSSDGKWSSLSDDEKFTYTQTNYETGGVIIPHFSMYMYITYIVKANQAVPDYLEALNATEITWSEWREEGWKHAQPEIKYQSGDSFIVFGTNTSACAEPLALNPYKRSTSSEPAWNSTTSGESDGKLFNGTFNEISMAWHDVSVRYNAFAHPTVIIAPNNSYAGGSDIGNINILYNSYPLTYLSGYGTHGLTNSSEPYEFEDDQVTISAYQHVVLDSYDLQDNFLFARTLIEGSST